VNTVTSDVVTHGALEPALDAEVLNHDQARLIYDPSPQIDSLVELVDGAFKNAVAMARLLSELAASNGLELDRERMIAGFADDLAAALRHCEHNTTDGPLSARRLAAELAPMLDVLSDPSAPFDYAPAVHKLRGIFAATPHAALFAKSTLHHLRPKREAALRSAYKAWTNERARLDHAGHRESRS
jgi:hypothetical protein